MEWSKLDFGNPENSDLLYCNEEGMSKLKFNELRREVSKAAELWNPKPSFSANFSYWHMYCLGEFMLRLLKWMLRLVRQLFINSKSYWMKFVH